MDLLLQCSDEPHLLRAMPPQQQSRQLWQHLNGPDRLAAELMYGSGIRVKELVSLRVKDLDFARGQLVIRGGKGDKDRVTILPERL